MPLHSITCSDCEMKGLKIIITYIVFGGWIHVLKRASEAAHSKFKVQPKSSAPCLTRRDSTARYQLHPNTTITALLCRPLLLLFLSHAQYGQASRYHKAKRSGPDHCDCALANDWSASARSNGTAQDYLSANNSRRHVASPLTRSHSFLRHGARQQRVFSSSPIARCFRDSSSFHV